MTEIVGVIATLLATGRNAFSFGWATANRVTWGWCATSKLSCGEYSATSNAPSPWTSSRGDRSWELP